MALAEARFELVSLKGGEKSIRSSEYGETMHVGSGPECEAQTLHVEQQRLVERALAWKEARPFVIWDVGLGPAGNATTALKALKQVAAEGLNVSLHSFEVDTSVLEFALGHREAIPYLRGWEEALHELLDKGEATPLPGVRWQLHRGPFAAVLDQAPPASAIFHDPYSPAKNPEMWSLELFQRMRAYCEGERALLTNYTRSTAVRATLALAGWAVGAGVATGEKDQTTIAATHLEDLAHPLGSRWLDRVRRSKNGAPFRGGVYQPGPITPEDLALLERQPQFLSC